MTDSRKIAAGKRGMVITPVVLKMGGSFFFISTDSYKPFSRLRGGGGQKAQIMYLVEREEVVFAPVSGKSLSHRSNSSRGVLTREGSIGGGEGCLQ